MVSSVGLAAAYPGYLQARNQENTNQLQGIQIENAQTEQQGNEAFGNTIKMFQQQMPGQQPMGGGGGMPQPMQAGMQQPQAPQAPQAPAPGQPSQPMQPPQVVQGNGPSPLDSAPYPAGPVGAPGPGQPAPGGTPAPQMPPGGQQQQQNPDAAVQQALSQSPLAGKLDLRTIMSAVSQANPTAKPGVIAAAVNKFLPLMTAQAQMDWKTYAAALGAGRLDNQRQEHIRKEDQGNRRLDQADTRLDDTRDEYNSRDRRRGEQTEQGNRGLGIRENREGRMAIQAEIRNDQRNQQLDIQRQSLEARIQQGGDRQALSQWRAIVDAQHKRALEIIQSGKNAIGVMDSKERAALVAEQNEFYRKQIEQMRQGPARPERPAGADTTGRPEGPKATDRAPGAAPAAVGPVPVPPAFAQQPDGTKFQKDGRTWVKQGNQMVPEISATAAQ